MLDMLIHTYNFILKTHTKPFFSFYFLKLKLNESYNLKQKKRTKMNSQVDPPNSFHFELKWEDLLACLLAP